MTNPTWLYVGLIYAAGVWLARRGGAPLPRLVAALFFALVLLYLWRPLTQDCVIVAGDVIDLTTPWSEIRGPNRPPRTKYDVTNLNLQDVPLQIAPWIHQVRESWKSFDAPLWNAAAGCGYPLLGNGQSTALSPLHVLTLPLPLGRALTAECAMKLLLALVLTYLFCRRRYSETASVFAAIVFGFSTWMTTWMQFPIAAAAAFLPGVLLVVDMLLERPSRRRILGAALMFAVAVLTGHPETIYHIGLIAAAYGLWVVCIERRLDAAGLKSLLAVLAAAAVALLLSSPFLVTFAEAVLRSQRLADIRTLPVIVEPPFSDFRAGVLLLQPRFFGELPIERPWGPTSAESVCGFPGVFAMSCVAAAAIYLFMKRQWRQREALYVLGTLFSFGVVMGWPVITDAFHAIAGLAPLERLRIALCWFPALLVGAVIDRARRESRVPLLVGAAAIAATMLWLLRTVQFPTPGDHAAAVLSLLPSMAVLAAVAVLPLRRGAIAAIALLSVAELWIAMGTWDPVLPPRTLYRSTPLIAALQREQQRDPVPHRVLGMGGQLYPNAGVPYGLDDVRVHDPMADGHYVDFLGQTMGWDRASYFAKVYDTSTPLLDFLNVKYVVTEPRDEIQDRERYREVYTGRDGRVYENRHVLPLFYPVRNVVVGEDVRTHTDWRYTALVKRLTRQDHQALAAPWTTGDAEVSFLRHSVSRYTVRVRTPRPTLVVSSITKWPGWRAGGLPIVEVNGTFLGFIVPAGAHEVSVVYRPLTFWVPAALSLLTLATVLALLRTPRADRAR